MNAQNIFNFGNALRGRNDHEYNSTEGISVEHCR